MEYEKINVHRIEKFNNEKAILKYRLLIKMYDKNKDKSLKDKALEIRNKIIEQNIPLIFDLANTKGYSLHMYLGDLLDIGAIAIINAVDEYKFDKNTKFSTYVGYLAINMMSSEISKWYGEGKESWGRAIRQYNAIAIKEFGNKSLIYDQEIIDYIIGIMIEEGFIQESNIKELKSRLLSMNKVSSEETENIENEPIEDIDKITFIRAHKDKLFESLTEYEKNVVEYICGFKGGYPYSVKEVAEIYGVKHQVTSQTYKRALIKMRKNIN